MITREELAAKISEYIGYTGKLPTYIAKEMGVSDSTIFGYMKGRNVPPLIQFKKLCKVLNCEYEDILGKLEE